MSAAARFPGLLMGPATGLAALFLAACAPTLSQPTGDVFLEAMAEGGRHHSHGRDRPAAVAYERAANAAERRVDRDEARYRAARALIREEDTAAAEELLREIADARPRSRRTARARLELGRLLLQRGAAVEGRTELGRVVLEHPDSGPAIRATRHLVVSWEEDTESAVEFLQRAYEEVGLRDVGDDILFELAELWIREGREQEAEQALERLIAEHPYPHGGRWDDASIRLSELAEESQRWDTAIDRLSTMLQSLEDTGRPGSYVRPRMPEAQLRLARLHVRKQEWELAVSAYQTLYEQFETSRLRDDALVELGELQLQRGDAATGCATLQRSVEEFDVGAARRRALGRLHSDCRPAD